MRNLVFLVGSKAELDAFPAKAKQAAGRQLMMVQLGHDPVDWKPMASVGAGAAEIRIKDETGAYRVIYVAKFKDSVYVLRCFKKQSQKTSQRDLDTAAARYRLAVRQRPSD